MRKLFPALVIPGILLYLLATTVAWKTATEAYESRFLPLPADDSKPVYYEEDSYCWIVYAQDMAREGKWRIRHSNMDNAPWGREMHYSQSVAWCLALAGKVRSLLMGESWALAIGKAGIWVNPTLFAVFLCGIFWLIERRMGLVPALLTVIWLLASGDMAWAFHPLRPDHQTFHLIFSLLPLVLLTLGGLGWVSPSPPKNQNFAWFRPMEPPSRRVAGRYFATAGVAQALGIWIGAVVQAPFVALTVLGIAGFLLVFRSKFSRSKLPYDPHLWRIWAVCGAAASLIMYAVEYFPGHLSWRLEVNHPLYAMEWILAGELVVWISKAQQQGRRRTPREWMHLAGLILLGAVLPAVIFFGGEKVHVLRDPQSVRMLSLINEFKPLWQAYGDAPVSGIVRDYLVLPLFLPAGVALLFSSRASLYGLAALWMAIVSTGVLLVLAAQQRRWAGFYGECNIWLMVLVVLTAWNLILRKRVWQPPMVFACLLMLFLPLTLFGRQWQRIRDLSEGTFLVEQVTNFIMARRFALEMKELSKGRDLRLMADPGMAPTLYYFANIKTVGSFYWENLEGLHDMLAFFDATDDAEAKRIVESRGITHVVISNVGDAPESMHFARTGELETRGNRPNFARRLATHPDEIPAWCRKDDEMITLEAMKWRMGSTALQNNIKIWKIVPDTK